MSGPGGVDVGGSGGLDVSAQVDALEAKGLIRVASYRPELEYLFRHWLVQDAAYGSLLKQERRELHRQVGEALETLYPDRLSELAGILAMHFEQAEETDRAIAYLVADARYALERYAIREAFAAAERALGLMGPPSDDDPPERRRSRVELEVVRARAGLTFRPPQELIASLGAVLAVAESADDSELLAQVHLMLLLIRLEHGNSPDDPEVRRSIDRLDALSTALGDPTLTAFPLAMLAMNKVQTGPLREGVEALETAIPMMQQRGDSIGGAFALGWLAMGYAELGEFARADEVAAEAVRRAAKGDLIAQLDAQISEAMVRATRGDLDEAEPLARACVDRASETGATACAMVSAWVLGDIYHRRGSYREADEALRLGIEMATGIGAQSWGPTLQAWRRANAAVLGDPESPEGEWEETLATMRRNGNHLGVAAVLWKRADARARHERWDDSFADYETAARILEEQGARPTLARVLRSWGDALTTAGRQTDADAVLTRALALFEGMGLDREAGEVRLALAAQGQA